MQIRRGRGSGARLSTVIGVALLLSPTDARPQQQTERIWSGEVPAGAELRVFTVRGDIQVELTPERVAVIRAARSHDQPAPPIRFEVLTGRHIIVCGLLADRSSCEPGGVRRVDRRQGPNAWADFSVRVPPGVDVRVATGGGDLGLIAETLRGTRKIVMETGSGDIQLTLSPRASAHVDAKTVTGEIVLQSPFRVHGLIRSDSLGAVLGDGRASIQLSTGSGDILLGVRSAPPSPL